MVDMVFVNNELSDTVTVGERAFINFEKRRAWQHACEGILSSRLKVQGVRIRSEWPRHEAAHIFSRVL